MPAKLLIASVLLLLLAALPAHAAGKTMETVGLASFYAPRFHGRPTASGELFDKEALTAAHRTLPFGTLVRVKNLRNGRSIVVRINDRGPFWPGRIVDLSVGAARALGFLRAGKAPVKLEVVKRP